MAIEASIVKPKFANLVYDEEQAFTMYCCYDASKQDACMVVANSSVWVF